MHVAPFLIRNNYFPTYVPVLASAALSARFESKYPFVAANGSAGAIAAEVEATQLAKQGETIMAKEPKTEAVWMYVCACSVRDSVPTNM